MEFNDKIISSGTQDTPEAAEDVFERALLVFLYNTDSMMFWRVKPQLRVQNDFGLEKSYYCKNARLFVSTTPVKPADNFADVLSLT